MYKGLEESQIAVMKKEPATFGEDELLHMDEEVSNCSWEKS